MFRCVTVAHADIPCVTTDLDCLPFLQTGVTQWNGGDAIGKVERALGAAQGVFIRVHARPDVIGQRLGRGHIMGVQLQHPRHQPRGARGRKRGPLIHEPAHKADVIRMIMRANHAGHGLACQWSGQQLFPNLAGLFGVKAGVDDCPAVPVIQRIDIHMIQRHRQRQPHPQHTIGDGDRLALGGRFGERIADASGHLGDQIID